MMSTVASGIRTYPAGTMGQDLTVNPDTQTPIPVPHQGGQSATSKHIGEEPQKDGEKLPKSNAPSSGQVAQGSDVHAIFAERSELFMGALGAACESQNVKVAVAIVVDPTDHNRPIVYVRGGEYDAARLLASLLRKLQQQVMEQITP